MEATIALAEAGGTVGEWSGALRDVFGEFRAPTGVGGVVSPDAEAIAVLIIAMAHSLKLSVVAEGVETDEQRSFLQSKQCDIMQGYLVSRPLPIVEITNFLTAESSQPTMRKRQRGLLLRRFFQKGK